MKKIGILALLGGALSACTTPAPVVSRTEAPTHAAWNEELARKFVRLSIVCTQKDSPHEFEDRKMPIRSKKAHPAFFGCYDWHSGVHGHWAMIRVLKSFPKISERPQIEAILNAHLKPELLQKEFAYFKDKPRYELPYGQGWFLRLSAELRTWNTPDAPANKQAWLDALVPLEKLFQERLLNYWSTLSRPIRHGDHFNTAFAMMHAWDYAQVTQNGEFARALSSRAREFFAQDRRCGFSYEPSAYDFLSACLIEADLLRRVLPAAEFRTWYAAFAEGMDASFLTSPVFPKDKKDPYLGHLIGLMFSKAWVLHALAATEGVANSAALENGARIHEEAGIETMLDSGYGGEHWLATFAIYDHSH